jgi:hypothetical protein
MNYQESKIILKWLNKTIENLSNALERAEQRLSTKECDERETHILEQRLLHFPSTIDYLKQSAYFIERETPDDCDKITTEEQYEFIHRRKALDLKK